MSDKHIPTNKNILVTGLSGFVGPYLERLLVSQGFRVFGLSSQERENTVDMYVGDICDSVFVHRVVQEVQPGIVFHMAGFSSVKKSFEEPLLTRQVNVGGTKNILDAISANVPDSKVLIVSSAEVYGSPVHIPIPESEVYKGLSPYALSRIEQEQLVGTYANLFWVIVRSFNHTGPGQLDTFVISDFCKQVVRIEKGYQEPVLSVGNLDAVRDFSDVRDVVQAYLLLMTTGGKGQIYNVGSGQGHSLMDILRMILSLSKVSVEIREDPSKMRKTDIPVLVADISKIKNEIGWQPVHTLAATIADILDYYRTIL